MTNEDFLGYILLMTIGSAIITAVGRIGAAIAYGIAKNLK